MNSFTKNWKFSEKHMDQIKAILRQLAMHIVKIEVATPDEDMQTATDLKIKITAGDVAVRVRRPNCAFRDITIRSINKGNRTEIHKLRDGYGDWYLYAWTDESGICEWVLYDIHKMRESGILDQKRSTIPNGDGTGFYSYSINELSHIGAVIEHHNNTPPMLQPTLFDPPAPDWEY